MIGKTQRRFWKHFDALPPGIQKLAREKYALWKRDPRHTHHFTSKNDATAFVWCASATITARSDFAKAM